MYTCHTLCIVSLCLFVCKTLPIPSVLYLCALMLGCVTGHKTSHWWKPTHQQKLAETEAVYLREHMCSASAARKDTAEVGRISAQVCAADGYEEKGGLEWDCPGRAWKLKGRGGKDGS